MTKIEHGDIKTAKALLLISLDMINEAGVFIEIRNPGRLAGDWIEITRERIEESNIGTE